MSVNGFGSSFNQLHQRQEQFNSGPADFKSPAVYLAVVKSLNATDNLWSLVINFLLVILCVVTPPLISYQDLLTSTD